MAEKGSKFVIEGELTLGPYEYPVIVDRKVLGFELLEHFQAERISEHYRIGRARITVELLEP